MCQTLNIEDLNQRILIFFVVQYRGRNTKLEPYERAKL